MVYKGWIPTVSGQLSFNLVGASSHPTKAETFNESLKSSDGDIGRYIVSRQKRLLLDSTVFGHTFKRSFNNRFYGIDGSFHFLLVACSSCDSLVGGNKLVGKVYVYTDDYCKIRPNVAIRSFFSQAEALRSKIKDGTINNVEAECLAIELFGTLKANSYKSFAHFIDVPAICNADIEISASGKVSITVDPEYNTVSDERDEVLAEQIYFFLKDISHTHQHHHGGIDNVLTVFPRKSWKEQTAARLIYRVVRLKRKKDSSNASSSLGMLSYLNSFIDTFQPKTAVDTTALQYSIEAMWKDSQIRDDKRKNWIALSLSTFISLTAVFFSLASLFRVTVDSTLPNELIVDEAGIVKCAAFMAVNHPAVIMLPMLCISLLTFLVVTKTVDLNNSFLYNVKISVYAAFGKWWGNGLFIAFGASLGFVFFAVWKFALKVNSVDC